MSDHDTCEHCLQRPPRLVVERDAEGRMVAAKIVGSRCPGWCLRPDPREAKRRARERRVTR